MEPCDCREMHTMSKKDVLGELLTCDPDLVAPDIDIFQQEEAIYVRYA
jgi:hypothetical protein